MDVLSDVLSVLHLRAHVFFQASLCGAWSVDASGSGKATYHVIARGNGWLHMSTHSAPIPLRGGDLVVFPRDAEHVISASPEPPDLPSHSGVVQGAEEGPATTLVCGYFEFRNCRANPLLDALPDVVHIRGEDDAVAGRTDMLLRFIAAEAEGGAAGAEVMVDRLSDALFIHVIRDQLGKPSVRPGLLAALGDPRIRKALQALHQRPEDSWTVERLAQTAAMSRAGFAKRFQELMARSPMEYVTAWRMQLAERMLAGGELPVAVIATRCGYQTEAAFRKAFRRHTGYTPGWIRKSNGERGTDLRPVGLESGLP